MRIWHHRHPGPLLTLWGVAALIAAALYWMESSQPALREMVQPLYYIVAAGMLFTTWRWFRVRDRKDRRHGDRRRNDRRGEDDEHAA
jgi:membrane protein implicated in regulation of membrane protease activity